jgi:hypothetical protein
MSLQLLVNQRGESVPAEIAPNDFVDDVQRTPAVMEKAVGIRLVQFAEGYARSQQW